MTSRKLFTSLIAALVAAATLAFSAPVSAIEETRHATLALPAGHLLQGQVVDGAWSVAAVPLDAAATLAGAGARKECDNDVPGGYSYVWYPVSTAQPLAEENAASQGRCIEETHRGPVSLMQFRSAGDWYGSVYAEGCVLATGACGWYQVSCSPVGAAIGAPGPGSWGTYVSGRDMDCAISSEGTQPHEWESWEAYVGNAHATSGSAYALFV